MARRAAIRTGPDTRCCADASSRRRWRWSVFPPKRVSSWVSPIKKLLQLTSLAQRLAAIFADRNIDIVLTHPYEGGHPDHDATAFAVHGASWLISRRNEAAPGVVEMAFYHGGSDRFCAQRFVPAAGAPVITVPLSSAAWALKQRMLAAHASQAEVVAQFTATVERFRSAPCYDFSAPANGGSVYYEGCDWGMTAARWCQLAAESMHELRWPPPRHRR